jgi:hypothetical protein
MGGLLVLSPASTLQKETSPRNPNGGEDSQEAKQNPSHSQPK